ncbi:MAG TPA: hypothetical protein VJP86_17360 [Vicinamibacterales bacterium]|nr:hypothetical protein [Vicinamibacterales bacterium]
MGTRNHGLGRIALTALWLLGTAGSHPAAAGAALEADLHPATAAAFDAYVAERERQLGESESSETRFLWIDHLPDGDRSARLNGLRAGALLIEPLKTTRGGRPIDVPDGMIHHWLGTVFVKGASLDRTLQLLQDYDRHAEIFKPAVSQSRILSQSGGTFLVSLRFYMKKVLTVVVDGEHRAQFTRAAANRAFSRIVSLRLAEVDNAGTAEEREKPVGHDGGYLWRINSYWRFLERDGGTYIQCETITLSRSIPFGIGWMVRPFVTSIPRESLTFTLETARSALQQSNR